MPPTVVRKFCSAHTAVVDEGAHLEETARGDALRAATIVAIGAISAAIGECIAVHGVCMDSVDDVSKRSR